MGSVGRSTLPSQDLRPFRFGEASSSQGRQLPTGNICRYSPVFFRPPSCLELQVLAVSQNLSNNGRLGQDLEQCQIKDRECPNNRVGYACPWRGKPNQQTVSYKSPTEKRNERPKIGRINYRECAKRRKRNSRKSIDIRSRLRRLRQVLARLD